jgi:transglutaminase-like putative cysteine protease
MITLEMMTGIVRSGFRDCSSLALDVCSSQCTDSVSTSVLAIDRFLRTHFVYRGEKDEVLRTVPYMLNDFETLGEMQGDCDDMAMMGAAMLLAVDIPARFTALKSVPHEFDHVFCEGLNDGQWMIVDPTVPYGTTYKHFGIAFQAI